MFRSIFCFDYLFFPAVFFVINGVFVTIVTIIIFIVFGGLSFTWSLLFFFFAGSTEGYADSWVVAGLRACQINFSSFWWSFWWWGDFSRICCWPLEVSDVGYSGSIFWLVWLWMVYILLVCCSYQVFVGNQATPYRKFPGSIFLYLPSCVSSGAYLSSPFVIRRLLCIGLTYCSIWCYYWVLRFIKQCKVQEVTVAW